MNIHLTLQSDSELITYEGMALALVLASFDHQVQIVVAKSALSVLNDPKSRLHGMAKSAPLYDLPPLWVDDWQDLKDFDDDIVAVFCPKPKDKPLIFDSFLIF